MSLNPAAKRLVRRYSKLSDVQKEMFLQRTAFNYKDARSVRSLVDWAAENHLPQFLEKFLHDANRVHDTDLIDYVVERIYQQRNKFGEQGAELFQKWVSLSNFNCERACVNMTEVWDLKWIHNLIPYINNEDTRYLAYNSIVHFCAPITADSGFCNPENIIKPYYERLVSCLISDAQFENMMHRLHNDCKPSQFLESISCGAQKLRLELQVGEGCGMVLSRKI